MKVTINRINAHRGQFTGVPQTEYVIHGTFRDCPFTATYTTYGGSCRTPEKYRLPGEVDLADDLAEEFECHQEITTPVELDFTPWSLLTTDLAMEAVREELEARGEELTPERAEALKRVEFSLQREGVSWNALSGRPPVESWADLLDFLVANPRLKIRFWHCGVALTSSKAKDVHGFDRYNLPPGIESDAGCADCWRDRGLGKYSVNWKS